jgi:hypothetical protein
MGETTTVHLHKGVETFHGHWMACEPVPTGMREMIGILYRSVKGISRVLVIRVLQKHRYFLKNGKTIEKPEKQHE